MILYICAVLALLLSIVLAVAIGSISALHGALLVVLRVVLLLLGIVGAAALVWLARKRAASAGQAG